MFKDLGPEGTAALITVVGVVIAGIVSFFGARYAAKQSTIVAKDQAAIAGKDADTNSWDKLVVSLQNELRRLGSKVEALETQAGANDIRIQGLEKSVREGDVKYRVALQYIHDVIAWTKSIIKTDTVPPEAPQLIAPDLHMQ